MSDSSISKFFEKNRKERLDIVSKFSGLTSEEIQTIENSGGGISFEQADKMIENGIGTFSLPFGIATNFRINDKDYLIPMVIEEPSVIAASSKAAKIARIHGGFKAESDPSFIIGQIQVVNVDIKSAISKIQQSSDEILRIANSQSTTLPKLGKGAKEVSCKKLETNSGTMLIVELLIDAGDAMGANVTNSMCEAVAPLIEKITGGNVVLKILSNYSTKRLSKATAIFDKESIGGEKIVNRIIQAYDFAANDVFRAVTHNKGLQLQMQQVKMLEQLKLL